MNDFLLLLGGAVLGAGGVGLGLWLQARRTPPPPDIAALTAGAAERAAALLAPRLTENIRDTVAAQLAEQRAAQPAAPPPPDMAALAAAAAERAAAELAPRIDETIRDAVAAQFAEQFAEQRAAQPAAPPPPAPEAPQPEAAEEPPRPSAESGALLADLIEQRRQVQEKLDALETRRTILPHDVFSRRRSALYGELEGLAARERALRSEFAGS